EDGAQEQPRKQAAGPPARSSDSFRGQRVDFNFLPAIQRAQAAALGVTADVPRFDAFDRDDAAEFEFEILAVRAHAEAGGIVGVVIIKRGHAGLELWVV